MFQMGVLLFLGLFPALSTATNTPQTEEEIVTLTMTERAGADRESEWVTIGVPLPKGLADSTEELCLIRDGRTIPCEMLPVNEWWDDGSLRWVHLIFQGSCPANGKACVTLSRGRPAPMPERIITAKETPERFVIDTGAISFEVNKKRFNVIDVVTAKGRAIVEPHKRGLLVHVEGQEYPGILDPDVTVAIEEKGPLHAVLRARGSLRNAGGRKKFDFDCPLYAYAGSSEIRIVVTLINRQGRDADHIGLSGFTIELPTTIRRGTCLFGSEDGRTKRGDLSDNPQAYMYQMSSDEHLLGGAVEGKGGGRQTKSNNIGWGYLSDGRSGIGAGIRWFWQLYPKSVEFTRGGIANHKGSRDQFVRIPGVRRRSPPRLDLWCGRSREYLLGWKLLRLSAHDVHRRLAPRGGKGIAP